LIQEQQVVVNSNQEKCLFVIDFSVFFSVIFIIFFQTSFSPIPSSSQSKIFNSLSQFLSLPLNLLLAVVE